MSAVNRSKPAKTIGQSVERTEDKRMVRGLGRYVGDIAGKTDALTMVVLRSAHGFATIKSIDTRSAKAVPGVVAIYTATDIEDLGALPCDWVPPTMTQVPQHPILAKKTVRYVGQPVAVVLAENRHSAIDALESITVDYDVRKPVVGQELAYRNKETQLHSNIEGNIAYHYNRTNGDVDEVLKSADIVLKRRYYNNRITAATLEGRAVLSEFDEITGHILHHTSSQLPHVHGRALAKCLGFPLHKLRLVSPDVGGGFGAKLGFYAEDVLCAHAAITLKRSVRWIEGRDENFAATTHGRDHMQYVELSATKEGKILGLKVKLVADIGAYAMGMGPGIPAINGGLSLSGPYKIPNADFTVQGVYTNRMPTGPYRGAGHPEASYVLERVMTELATELGLDPRSVRKLNFITPAEMPYRIPTGFGLDSGDFAANLDKASTMAGFDSFADEKKKARANGRYIGHGIAFYTEMSGAAPTLGMFAAGFDRSGHESGRVMMHPDGKVTVYSGSHSQGQGHQTSFAQIAADTLQISFEDIDVVQGDTAAVPFGTGTYNSRSMAVGGTAIHLAARKIIKKATQIAAHKLQCRLEDVDYVEGVFSIKPGSGIKRAMGEKVIQVKAGLRRKIFKKMVRIDLPELKRPDNMTEISLAEVAREAYIGHDLPFKMPHGLDETVFFDPKGMPTAFGTHISVVEVDIETGQIKLLRHLALDDCGNIINPKLAEGQIHGGLAQGIGQALMEQLVYNENGDLSTDGFDSYAMPRASDFPDFETGFTVTPTKFNPLGVRGVGESGTIGAPPAVVNAVMDALSEFDIENIDMPMTPSKVWAAVRDTRSVG